MENVQAFIGDGMGGARSRLRRMLAGGVEGTPLIDIGATSLTAVRAGKMPGFGQSQGLGHPTLQTLALTPKTGRLLKSDFLRTGLLFEQPEIRDGVFVDGFGVQWQWEDDCYSPVKHPLENAGLAEVAKHPKPLRAHPLQGLDPESAAECAVIADAACPGLLDLCFQLRGTWQFVSDIASDPQMAISVLDWSLEAIMEAYAHMLKKLPHEPDIVTYCDDLGCADSMFFSPADFRDYLLPRMRVLLAGLRDLGSAAVCFHSCGAIDPILPDIADLGIEIINLDAGVKKTGVKGVREKIPASMILHGTNDLSSLGEAVVKQDKGRVAFLITELAESAPVIAAPMDSLNSIEEVQNAVRGAAFIRNLSDEDFTRLRQIGPVRSIIEEALRKTLAEDRALLFASANPKTANEP